MDIGTIADEPQLEDLLSQPSPEVIASLGQLPGDILILGVAGKMGPTLARMARRASEAAGVTRRVIGVARFSGGGEAELRSHGIETIRCDLLDEQAVAGLPDVPNVVFMAGMKFGTTGNEALTWAMNTYLPALVCRKFAHSRIVAFSTGNVYGLSPVSSGGSRESDPCVPVGEYAMSCLGRERVFEHFSRSLEIPLSIFRLNYACELRYGVLVDIAERIAARQPVDLTMGYFNTLWQGDANAMALRCFEFASVPPWVVNVTGPEQLSTRDVATRLAGRMNCPVQFQGVESDQALLNNAERGLAALGSPRVSVDQLLDQVADWVQRGKKRLGKPTHYDSRDGSF